MFCQEKFLKMINEQGRAELTYKTTPQRDLQLTFLPPICKKYNKAPIYFIIPGGGWHVETRQSMIDFSSQSVEMLRAEGFAVVSIDYRVRPEGVVMREILADCFDAARYVAHFADELGVDKDCFVTSGHSAGAHLALMLAYAPQDAFQDGCEFTDAFKVKATAVMSAPTALQDNSTNNLRNLKDLFVGEPQGEMARTSPITYVTDACPPTFLSAGTSDYLVFANSSEMLYEKLVACGVKCELLLSIGGGHCFEQIHGWVQPSVAMSEVQEKLVQFIRANIG